MLAISRPPSVSGALAPTDFSSRSAGYLREVELVSASVRTFADQPNEHTGQKREDERLQKCDEQFKKRDAERDQNRRRYQDPAPKSEDQAYEGQQDNVSRDHVGE